MSAFGCEYDLSSLQLATGTVAFPEQLNKTPFSSITENKQQMFD